MPSPSSKIPFFSAFASRCLPHPLICLLLLLAWPIAGDAATLRDRVGINISNVYYDGASTLSPDFMAALSGSGAGWVRINVLWGWTVEGRKGVFDWKGLDDTITKLKAAHIQVLMILNGPVPCWAIRDSAAGCNAPRNTVPMTGAWKDFVTTVVRRYGNYVKYWEIWNEPDQDSMMTGEGVTVANRLALYRDAILIPAADAVHAAGMGGKVVAGALSVNPPSTAPQVRTQEAVRLILSNAVAEKIDVFSIHVYNPFDLVAYGRAAKAAMAAAGAGAKPLWLTEMGVAQTVDPNGNMARKAQESQATYVRKQFMPAISSGVYDKIFWFALTDGLDVQGRHVDGYGLIRNNDYKTYQWQPRQAFDAFRRAIGQP